MGNPLRDRRAPEELASRSQVIDFDEELGQFERLADSVAAELEQLDSAHSAPVWRNARVAGRLEWYFADAQRQLPALKGQVSTTLDGVCQRCLGPLQVPLSVDLRLLFTDAGTAGDLPTEFEVWELDEPVVRPLDLVDESLVMALPFAATHADGCGAAVEAADVKKGNRPFADLRARMQDEN